mmetsp:Transcript_86962/g.225918  ORF Transcript_86962/g.225918 Transcript_86962/m.225918 type:complete len:331 (+) Transcript_86962:817-1809(+)
MPKRSCARLLGISFVRDWWPSWEQSGFPQPRPKPAQKDVDAAGGADEGVAEEPSHKAGHIPGLLFSSAATAQRRGSPLAELPSISNIASSTSRNSPASRPSSRGEARFRMPSLKVRGPTLKSMSRPFTEGSMNNRTVNEEDVCDHAKPSPSPPSTTFNPRGTSGSASLGATLPCEACSMEAREFKALTTWMVVSSSCGLAISILLTSTTSAHSTCSARSWPTFSSRALFFSSWRSPCTCSFLSWACLVSSQSCPKVLASTTVMTRLTSVLSATGMVHSKPIAQFFFTASGSPTPLSSTTMCSKTYSFERMTMFCTAEKRSSAEEQQTQPF